MPKIPKLKVSISKELADKEDVLIRVLCAIVVAYEVSRLIFLSGEAERIILFELAYGWLVVITVWFYLWATIGLMSVSLINYLFIRNVSDIGLKHILMQADSIVCIVIIMIVFVLNIMGKANYGIIKRE